MNSHVIDSRYLNDLFGTPELRRVFSDTAQLQSWLDFEAALARGRGCGGLGAGGSRRRDHPRGTRRADRPRRVARGGQLHRAPAHLAGAAIDRRYATAKLAVMSTGARPRRTSPTPGSCSRRRRPTASSWPICAAWPHAAGRSGAPRARHADAGPHPRPARHPHHLRLQGRRLAGRGAAARRAAGAARPSASSSGEFAGASTTLASIGDDPAVALEVQRRLMADLGLGVPVDRLARRARPASAELGGAAGADRRDDGQDRPRGDPAPEKRGDGAGRAAPSRQDRLEHDAAQAQSDGVRGDHGAGAAGAVARRPRCSNPMGTAEHERDWSAVHAEWAAVPEICLLTGAAVTQTSDVIRGLIVYRERMRQNVDALHGLILSEAVMLRLGRVRGTPGRHTT